MKNQTSKLRVVATIATATILSGGNSMVGARDLTGTLKKIADSGSITLSVRETQLPFSYIDGNQQITGYAVDLCKHVVGAIKKAVGREDIDVKTQPVTAQTFIPLLSNGTVDLDCAGVTNNATRQTQVAFSYTTFLSTPTFAYKKQSGLRTIDDLKGKTVASIAGTNNIAQLNQVNTTQQLGMQVLATKSVAEAFLMLSTDRAEAMVADNILLASLIAATPQPEAYAIADAAFGAPEPYALAMRRDDPEFKHTVDQALAEYFRSPAAEDTYKKWFMSAIPPKGINLKVPMSSRLQKAYANPTDSIDASAY